MSSIRTSYNNNPVPTNGQPIGYQGGKFIIPDRPIIPFVEGDGTGRDIWKASRRIFDAAVEKAYGGKRQVVWYEIYAGEKAYAMFQQWMPEDTIEAVRAFSIAIKGPLTTPVGGGIRSLNVTFRLRMPPPTGVVSGPLMAMLNARTASMVSSGIHCWNIA